MSQTVHEIQTLFKHAHITDLEHLIGQFTSDSRKGVQNLCAQAQARLERHYVECQRINVLYDNCIQASNGRLCIGVDEVGRGPLAGPLVVCAVQLPNSPKILGLNDSKLLTPSQRERCAAEISRHALSIGLSFICAHDIDQNGISSSLFTAMTEALRDAHSDAEVVLLDGVHLNIAPHVKAFYKGDQQYACIAAASIIAKVTRDNYMTQLSCEYPHYAWDKNMGYGTAEHIQAIKKYGLTPYHRKSFCKNI